MDEKEFDVINVIPFIDIMLVLLTIVLTTSTFIASGGIPVQLPRAAQSDAELLRTATIEIDRSGTIYYNANPVALDELNNLIYTLDRETPVLLRADRNLTLQVFVDVLDLVKQLGFNRVSLQTEDRK
jgi:biopolymer transport protein ExbD